jgi:hypothetical protein
MATYTVIVHPRPTIAVTNAVTGLSANYSHLMGCPINLTATGGTYYNWSQGGIFFGSHTNQLADVTNNIALPTTAINRTYTVVGIDQYGCSNTVSTTITIRRMVITRSFSNAPAGPTTTVAGNITPVYNNATYVWNGPGGYQSGPSGTIRNFSRIDLLTNLAGVYTATVTQAGCSQQVTFTLTPAGTVFKTTSGVDILYADENTNTAIDEQNHELNEVLSNVSETEIKMNSNLLIVSKDFQVYPNPATNILHIKGSMLEKSYVTVQIYTLDGKLVKDYNLGELTNLNNEVAIEDLPTGAYHLVLNGNTNTTNVIKFIKE